MSRSMLGGQEREAVGTQGAERGVAVKSHSMLVGQGMEEEEEEALVVEEGW